MDRNITCNGERLPNVSKTDNPTNMSAKQLRGMSY